jgi:cold shock CspA family protein
LQALTVTQDLAGGQRRMARRKVKAEGQAVEFEMQAGDTGLHVTNGTRV